MYVFIEHAEPRGSDAMCRDQPEPEFTSEDLT
jgi:hypothetical protein